MTSVNNSNNSQSAKSLKCASDQQSPMPPQNPKPPQSSKPLQSAKDAQASKTSQKSKPKKNIEVYILCGVISTFLITEVLMVVVGALFAALTNITIDAINNALFFDAIGKDGLDLLSDYTLFIGVAIVFFAVMVLVKPWRPYLKALGTAPAGNRGAMLAIGLAAGFLMCGACVLAASLTGSVQLEFKQFSVVGCIVFLVAILIQSSTEEIFCRCFAYQRVKRTYNATVAIIVSSVIFSLGHLLNPGLTTLALVMLFLTGVLYCMFVHYFDSIWLPAGLHTAWNFTQNVIFGLPNSGRVSTYSFFGLSDQPAGGIAYSTSFGLEGSVVAVVVTVLCILIVYLLGRRRRSKEKEFDIWKASADDPKAYKGWFY